MTGGSLATTTRLVWSLLGCGGETKCENNAGDAADEDKEQQEKDEEEDKVC